MSQVGFGQVRAWRPDEMLDRSQPPIAMGVKLWLLALSRGLAVVIFSGLDAQMRSDISLARVTLA